MQLLSSTSLGEATVVVKARDEFIPCDFGCPTHEKSFLASLVMNQCLERSVIVTPYHTS